MRGRYADDISPIEGPWPLRGSVGLIKSRNAARQASSEFRAAPNDGAGRYQSLLVMDEALLYPVVSMARVFQDDLPSVSASRLRASGDITAEMARTTVAGVEVVLDPVKFANGGSWSFFRCPSCGRRARTLKLLGGSVLCWRCCHRSGARYRVRTISLRGRAELRVPKLKGMLESKQSLRLKPHLRGTMERRSRLEAALRRCEFIMAQRGSPRKVKTIVDPCEEPDFKPPRRPWPRLKSKSSEPD
jgi:hypothetical protein